MNTEINNIIISDKQEHLRTITEDIVIQSKKLSHILEERDGVISRISDMKKELALAESKCNNVYSNIANLESKKEEILKQIQYKKDELSLIVKDIVDNKNVLNLTIEDLNNSISIAKNKLNTLISLKESISKEINDLKIKYDSDVEYYNSKQEKISLLKQEYEELKNTKNDFYNFFELEKKHKMDELSSLEKELNNAIEIIKNPMEALNKRESDFEKKERNFEILVSRFRKEFKKLHPDLNPVI
jgi:chromosome segregation protein